MSNGQDTLEPVKLDDTPSSEDKSLDNDEDLFTGMFFFIIFFYDSLFYVTVNDLYYYLFLYLWIYVCMLKIDSKTTQSN